MDMVLNGKIPNRPNEPEGLLHALNPSNQEEKFVSKNFVIMRANASLTMWNLVVALYLSISPLVFYPAITIFLTLPSTSASEVLLQPTLLSYNSKAMEYSCMHLD
jgi:hypothetical protein